MKILFLAPMPPPVTGHSLVSEILYDHLRLGHEVVCVDLSLGSKNDGSVTVARIYEVAKILKAILSARKDVDRVYLTISESLAGNLKDLIIYLLLWKGLSELVIHLHGGTIGVELLDRYRLLKWINSAVFKRVARIIISGDSHRNIFSMVPEERLAIVPNFAKQYLFLTDGEIANKFKSFKPLRVLYISNMYLKKGYSDLLMAYQLLDDGLKEQVCIDFAGKFYDETEAGDFARKIKDLPGVKYHGVVSDDEKNRLFKAAHVFCLPTWFLEGQPVSILEAYASGCVVLTTDQPGIRDIFRDGVNGFFVEQQSAQSIAVALGSIGQDPCIAEKIARQNASTARSKYKVERYVAEIESILT